MNIKDNLSLNSVDGEVGIEIEMEGLGLPTAFRKWWRAEYDGSLRGNSVEWVLTSPVTREEVNKALDFLVFKCQNSDLNPSDRCGVHVHINCQKESIKTTFVFACLYLLLEPLLMKWCGEQREGNMFCLRTSDAEGLLWHMIRALEDGNLNQFRTNDIRYASLNFLALTTYGSLEFRGMGTPKNLMDVQKWVEMLLALKDAAKNYKGLPEILEQISGQSVSNFLKTIFNEKQVRALTFPNMDDIIFSSARRLQDVAYADRGFPDKIWFEEKPLAQKRKPEPPVHGNREQWVRMEAAMNEMAQAKRYMAQEQELEVRAQEQELEVRAREQELREVLKPQRLNDEEALRQMGIKPPPVKRKRRRAKLNEE